MVAEIDRYSEDNKQVSEEGRKEAEKDAADAAAAAPSVPVQCREYHLPLTKQASTPGCPGGREGGREGGRQPEATTVIREGVNASRPRKVFSVRDRQTAAAAAAEYLEKLAVAGDN